LHELGYSDFSVHERADRVGGLAASYRDGRGFTWECGVHVLFSRSVYFNSVMESVMGAEWIAHRRDAQVWMGKRFIPYPLQYNIHRLPEDLARECELGLVQAASQDSDSNSFLEWIVHSFGEGIARHFMVPYNEKIWAVPLDRMSHSWISERVPRPDLARILANLRACRDDDTWGPNARFHYPRVGGIGAIWQRVARRIRSGQLRLGKEATRIDTKRRRVGFADGGSADYDVLVSTLPLDRLVDMAGLGGLREPAAELASSTVHAVGIGLAGETPAHLRDRRWIYYPEAAVPFYRTSVPSNFSPTNAPHGHWSLLAEVSESAHRPIDQGRLAETVIASAVREGMIAKPSQVVSVWRHAAVPGYPTPTKRRDAALAVLLPALENLGIYSRGRFGAWMYEISNQDHCFLQGVELAERLVLAKPERLLNGAWWSAEARP
jgi:protoporphyrinogen oxidase